MDENREQRAYLYTGEYYRDDDGITHEDRRQNSRLKVLEVAVDRLESDLGCLKEMFKRLETALIGHDGQHGMQQTMQDSYNSTADRLNKVDVRLNDLTIGLQKITISLTELATPLKTMWKFILGFGLILGIIISISEIISIF